MKAKKMIIGTILGVSLMTAGTLSSVSATASISDSQPQIEAVKADGQVTPDAKVKALVNGAKFIGGLAKDAYKEGMKQISAGDKVSWLFFGSVEENNQVTDSKKLEVLFDK
ncbi:hypothetical protein ACIGEL_19180 [Rossellomorea aquimaris]|uniref:hypothetical protein n=1 Tax=Rossellomorea aquimaris TaxID=189382 RepID=UPI0037C65EA7